MANNRRGVKGFLTHKHGGSRIDLMDVLSYAYLVAGVVVMFGPVLWLIMSSFKSQSSLFDFPPSFLPQRQETVMVEGYDSPLPLYDITFEDGTTQRLAQVQRVALEVTMVDPANSTAEPQVLNIREIADRKPVKGVYFDFSNYTDGVQSFSFFTYLRNSVIITVAATVVTLLINSMAAFGLSKYRYAGRDAVFLVMISTLMVPISVILIPAFLVITKVGWNNNLWGVIIPGAATPTGVFLLRQYMLTIPDELLESARIDGASEWRIYWQIILPLASPALAVLTIFSV
ncbi:MAG: carbohydrate ABC transporter permease, partial [Anaerolineae bacterium]|nr:carbohydrate ABC transporter permease [Anaerolineae bacterium]